MDEGMFKFGVRWLLRAVSWDARVRSKSMEGNQNFGRLTVEVNDSTLRLEREWRK